MNITVRVENIYANGTVTNVETVDIPWPPILLAPRAEYDDWAEDHLFPLTGTGAHRANDHARYEVTVTRCAARPDIVGRVFAWEG